MNVSLWRISVSRAPAYDSLYDWSYAMIGEIVTAIGNKQILSEGAQDFIESMPSPVYSLVVKRYQVHRGS